MLEKNPITNTIETAFGLAPALQECVATLLDFKRWSTLAWTDTRLRYRRTVLGPWWATLSTGAMIGSVGLVFGSIFGTDMSIYLPFFATGIIIWTFISSMLIESCSVFVSAGGLIKSIPSPIVLHVFRMQWRLLIALAHNVVLVAVVWSIFRWPVDGSILLALPGLAIVNVALFGAALTLGILCTRYRDIPQIITTLMQLLFLLTPIVWIPGSARGEHIGLLLYWNPLYHLLDIVRGPLLGQPPDLGTWLAAAFSSVVALCVGLGFYACFRHRIAYWL
jgi:ABC-2 type transport system permease protein